MGLHSKEFTISIDRAEKSPDIPTLIFDRIVELITKGSLNPGDKLPSELEMTRRFGISRISLREAMKLLQAKGFIGSHGRKGKYVKSATCNSLTSPIQDMIIADQEKLWELMSIKKIIDSEAAGMAALNANQSQIDELKKIQNQITREQSQLNGALDKEFYLNLAYATNNVMLSHLMESITHILHKVVSDKNNPEELPAEISNNKHSAYLNIITAIENREPETAKKAMMNYVNCIESSIKECF